MSAYHPTVETVGFPSLHFVTQKRGFVRAAAQKDSLHAASSGQRETLPADSLPEKDGKAMKTQQVPNSPYFIRYDDNGYCSVSRDKDGKELIPESEIQEFLGAVANGLLCIEQERKSRYQRIEEAEKAAFARGEAKGREDELLSTVRALKEEQVSRAEYERKLQYEVYAHHTPHSTRTEWVRLSRGGW